MLAFINKGTDRQQKQLSADFSLLFVRIIMLNWGRYFASRIIVVIFQLQIKNNIWQVFYCLPSLCTCVG